jgi:hypothetical protein
MKSFGVNSANDIYIASNGNLAVLSGIEAVAAACGNATRARLGEMVLNINNGIPYFETLWIGAPNYPLYQAYLRNALLSVPGVTEVKSINITKLGNTLKYTATIVTQFGTTEITNG